MKYIVIIFIIAILVSLGSALINMIKSPERGDKMLKSLKIRVFLSLLLFVLLIFAGYMGWIQPNDVRL